jgi:OmcA/MtrC family decaheme c-type cytochrome
MMRIIYVKKVCRINRVDLNAGGVMKNNQSAFQWFGQFIAASLLALGLAGCADDGSPGAPGAPGPGVAPLATATELNITITGASISSAPVVNFSVTNQDGVAVAGFANSDLRFNISKLVPGSNGAPSNWQSYLNRVSGGGVLGTQERVGSGTVYGTLVDHKDGTFTYTFATDITNPAANPCPAPCTDAEGNALDISYQPNLTHRVGIQQNNTALPKANATYDFVPAGGAVATTRDIVTTAKCNECHNKLGAHGGGMRIETKLCVTCHNPGSWDNTPGNVQTVDFKVMIHKIHHGDELPSVLAGTPYKVGTHDFSDVAFPQDIRNCTKCHDGTVNAPNATAQGDNWKNQPSRAACSSCHDDVYFTAASAGNPAYKTKDHPTLSGVGDLTDDSQCLTCHGPGQIEDVAVKHAVPLNVAVEKFKFNIKEICGIPIGAAGTSASCAAAAPITVKFSVTDPTGGTHGYPNSHYDVAGPTNADRDPEFGASASLNILSGWDSSDYNNNGGTGNRPARANSVSALTNATADPSGDGTFNITLPALPVASGSGVIAIEGHPRAETVVGSGTFNISVPVAGEVAYFGIGASPAVARRVAVDIQKKCDNCHSKLSLHGANRAENAQLCVICHNPRNTDVHTRPKDAVTGLPNASGPDGKFEESIDFKRLIHGIHGAGFREEGIVVYGYSASSVNDFRGLRFPGILNDCTTCHNTGTYELTGKWETPLQNGIQATTMRAVPDPTPGTFVAQEADQTNDLYRTPTAAVCSACHDGALAKAHMESIGGAVFDGNAAAISASFETCSVCHGPGRAADVKVVHGVK